MMMSQQDPIAEEGEISDFECEETLVMEQCSVHVPVVESEDPKEVFHHLFPPFYPGTKISKWPCES